MTVVSLEEKGPKNWIPVSLIKQWVDEDSHVGCKRRCTSESLAVDLVALLQRIAPDEASDDYAVESLLKLKHCFDQKEISDVESVTTALLNLHEKKKARREKPSHTLSKTVTYDLSQSNGFLRLKSVGRYQVRLEGDDSDEDSSKRQAIVMVHHKT